MGFMQIVGHGIPATAVAGLVAAIDGFFGLSVPEKSKWRAPLVEINRGYSGPLSERLSYSLGVATAADLFEAFNVGTPASAYPGLKLDPVHYPENLWPDQPAGFRANVETGLRMPARSHAISRASSRLHSVCLKITLRRFRTIRWTSCA